MAKTNKKNRNGKSTGNENGPSSNPDKLKNIFILTLLSVFILILFAKCITYEFTTWDDIDYITNNLLIRDFSLDGIKKIFTTPVIGMYNPIPFVIYAFEYKFWGLDPKPYNWSSLIFHILATIAIYKFIYQLTFRYETSSIVAILFAIHPMHVSVVVWACQTKTSLFLIFFFSGLICYLKYIQNNYKIKYLAFAALLFILSTLSKPSAVTFAPMLFLIDYYLSRKIEKRLLLEKIPFFTIAIFFGILTLLTHSDEGDSIFDVSHNYSLINNILVSNYAVVFYLEKLFYPLNLSAIYPYPENASVMPLKYYFSVPVIPLIIWIVYKSGKFRKEMIFGLLFFIIAISVLLRFIPSGFFGMANRYTYLSYTGLFFIMGQYFTYVMDNKFTYAARIKPYIILTCCIFLVFCVWRTTKRIKVWENSITLFTDVIEKQPKLAIAYNHRAAAKYGRGDVIGAAEDVTQAIELDSNFAAAYCNRGVYRAYLKDYDGALADYNKALTLDTAYGTAYMNRGNLKLDRDWVDEALSDYNTALRFNPELGNAYFNRGIAKVIKGDTTGSLIDWEKSKKLGIIQSQDFINDYSPKK